MTRRSLYTLAVLLFFWHCATFLLPASAVGPTVPIPESVHLVLFGTELLSLSLIARMASTRGR